MTILASILAGIVARHHGWSTLDSVVVTLVVYALAPYPPRQRP